MFPPLLNGSIQPINSGVYLLHIDLTEATGHKVFWRISSVVWLGPVPLGSYGTVRCGSVTVVFPDSTLSTPTCWHPFRRLGTPTEEL